MIKRRKFGYVLTGIVTLVMASGILAVWFGFYDSTIVQSDSRAIYHGSSSNAVALTFNVYSGEEIIPDILDVLSSKGVKATFFIGGCWATKNESVLKQIVESGHIIGSHGYLHRDHSKLNLQQNLEEMRVAHKIISGITGVDIEYFAPPSGAYSKNTLDAAEELGYKTILWSKDTIDWRDQNSELIFSRATKNIGGGDIVLMHPTAKTLEALPKIIDKIFEVGLSAESISNVI